MYEHVRRHGQAVDLIQSDGPFWATTVSAHCQQAQFRLVTLALIPTKPSVKGDVFALCR